MAASLRVIQSTIVPTKGSCILRVIFLLQVRSEATHFHLLSNMLFSTLTAANSSMMTAARDIKDTGTCLCLLPVGLLQLPVCWSASLRHSSTTVSTEWCCMPIRKRVEVWQCLSSPAQLSSLAAKQRGLLLRSGVLTNLRSSSAANQGD